MRKCCKKRTNWNNFCNAPSLCPNFTILYFRFNSAGETIKLQLQKPARWTKLSIGFRQENFDNILQHTPHSTEIKFDCE